MTDVQPTDTDPTGELATNGQPVQRRPTNPLNARPPGNGRRNRFRLKRRIKIPILLFVLTCFSTFWVGITDWEPLLPISNWLQNPDPFFMNLRYLLVKNWEQGLFYSSSVLLILLLHEFGHFFTTIFYRVPATVPIFLPFPFNPIGTLGAVIGMQGTLANRKQIFDIGIAGPLAGLVAAIPLAYFGVKGLDLTSTPQGGLGFRLPLLMQWIAESAGCPRIYRAHRVDQSIEPDLCRRMGRLADYGPEHDTGRPTGWRSYYLYAVRKTCALDRRGHDRSCDRIHGLQPAFCFDRDGAADFDHGYATSSHFGRLGPDWSDPVGDWPRVANDSDFLLSTDDFQNRLLEQRGIGILPVIASPSLAPNQAASKNICCKSQFLIHPIQPGETYVAPRNTFYRPVGRPADRGHGKNDKRIWLRRDGTRLLG